LETAPFLRLGRVTSTQDVAATLPIGSVVVAEEQTAGRGRQGRRWEAAPGSALLASFVMAPHRLASIAAGVAAAEACGARLKWPNDLLLDGRKLGGILVEAKPDRAVIGIGINLLAAPAGAARLERDREKLLDELHRALRRWLEAPPAAIVERWCSLSDTLGRRVRVDLGGETVEGVASGLAADGALLVDGRRIVAGDVVQLR
jgi:BirA family biotin operon repressor/biotin-[acetyl-CoA-carboxylase] ligase